MVASPEMVVRAWERSVGCGVGRFVVTRQASSGHDQTPDNRVGWRGCGNGDQQGAGDHRPGDFLENESERVEPTAVQSQFELFLKLSGCHRRFDHQRAGVVEGSVEWHDGDGVGDVDGDQAGDPVEVEQRAGHRSNRHDQDHLDAHRRCHADKHADRSAQRDGVW
jgi:hypothetical protein